MRARVLARRARLDEHRPDWVAFWWLVVGIVILAVAAACRQGVPVLDTGPRPVEPNGTISGTVRGADGRSPVEGRIVEVVNVDTSERQRATTSETGGFTFKVRPGTYRVQLTLLDGETLLEAPGEMQVNRSDVDAHADFVIGSRRGGAASRPRGPVNPIDYGLGSPIAGSLPPSTPAASWTT